MTRPPNAKAAPRQESGPAMNTGKTSHVRPLDSRRISRSWIREFLRLLAEAMRTNRRRDWMAVVIHLLGIIARIESK